MLPEKNYLLYNARQQSNIIEQLLINSCNLLTIIEWYATPLAKLRNYYVPLGNNLTKIKKYKGDKKKLTLLLPVGRRHQ